MPPTNFNRRTPLTWRMVILSAGIGSLLWTSQRKGPESASRGTQHPGRDNPGMVGDIISERWAELSRNGGRHHPGISTSRRRRGVGAAGRVSAGVYGSPRPPPEGQGTGMELSAFWEIGLGK